MEKLKVTNNDIVLQLSIIRDQIKEIRKNVTDFIRYAKILDDEDRKDLYLTLESLARDLRMQNIIIDESHQRIMIQYNSKEIYKQFKDL